MNGAENFENQPFELPEEQELLFDFDDEDIYDLDFSGVSGNDFKKSLKNVKKGIKKVQGQKKKKAKKNKAFIENSKKSKRLRIAKISVPSDRMLTVEDVDRYVMSDEYDWSKDIEHYKGKKLKQVILIFDNSNSAVDVTLDLFDPSSMVDYLQSNTQNINNQIIVADGVVKYSDFLFNILANPLMVINAKFVLAGSNITGQINENMFFKNKNSEGKMETVPTSLSMQINVNQKQRTVICFNLKENLNRPFIPDGMDVMQYKVLAGNSVYMVFYCEQHLLKKILFDEAANSKELM
jgi:hypothetical protein